ncbi:hypothetical protein VNO78_01984 [Psophocarpus tetragonolobus]|uniref:Secreted protein n=1 Tax=Psophocarpus tetragonolobus TaxID=3891 RepID=A0AAN9SYY4_PSOTE
MVYASMRLSFNSIFLSLLVGSDVHTRNQRESRVRKSFGMEFIQSMSFDRPSCESYFKLPGSCSNFWERWSHIHNITSNEEATKTTVKRWTWCPYQPFFVLDLISHDFTHFHLVT